MIAQIKGNQPALLEAAEAIAATSTPTSAVTAEDKPRRSRFETRTAEVFVVGNAFEGSEWNEHVAAIIRVKRETFLRITKTGLLAFRSETAYYACPVVPLAETAAAAIRNHWGIENRNHHTRDVSLGEDASRIRCNPGIFARMRSFALNILRFNGATNIPQARYSLALGHMPALQALTFM